MFSNCYIYASTQFACGSCSSQHVYSIWWNRWLVRSCSKLERKPLLFSPAVNPWNSLMPPMPMTRLKVQLHHSWFVILRVKHAVHPKSGPEMSEKTLYKLLLDPILECIKKLFESKVPEEQTQIETTTSPESSTPPAFWHASVRQGLLGGAAWED